jgi:hypothetical protein
MRYNISKNMLPQSSGWLNLVQVSAEVIWRGKCTDYTGRLQKLWPIGAMEKEAGFLLRQTALFRVTSGEKCERNTTLNIQDFSFGYSGWKVKGGWRRVTSLFMFMWALVLKLWCQN